MNQLRDETGITTFSINDAEFAAQNAFWRRRHAADETARLLAIAVASGVRCIAFAKTRCLVEWIYDKCIYLLKQDDSTLHLVSRIDSYRGGYTADVRRRIEEQLFQNKLMGVVGTSALELGVDIGGVDLTLHCGYPGSYTSLMQQAGRAGRGGNSRPSFSISVCFNSPSEQYLWKNPKALLGRSDASSAISSSFPVSNFDGSNIPVHVTSVVQDHSIPLDVTSIVQDHLLCAAAEFPLVGSHTVAYLLSCQHGFLGSKWKEEVFNMTDHFLFGLAEIYEMGVKRLCEKGALLKKSKIPGVLVEVDIYSAHSVSLLCIEDYTYLIQHDILGSPLLVRMLNLSYPRYTTYRLSPL
jgi:DEAD/DEAH box helicase domain-containing protein